MLRIACSAPAESGVRCALYAVAVCARPRLALRVELAGAAVVRGGRLRWAAFFSLVLLMCAVAARGGQRFALGVELACSALVRSGRHGTSSWSGGTY